jgi:proteic killer suppression protein
MPLTWGGKCASKRRAHQEDLPGYKFHALKGDRAGEYAVTVTGSLRMTYRFDGQHATAVNLEDYH